MNLLCYSHITRTTTWEDPRKTLAAQVANQQQRSAELLNTPHPATSPQPQPGELNSDKYPCFKSHKFNDNTYKARSGVPLDSLSL